MADVMLAIHKNMIGASLVAPLGFIFKQSSLRSLRDVIIVKPMMITTQVRHRTHFDLTTVVSVLLNI
jgi:hypothetical protein